MRVYAQNFDTVEINGSFYRIPQAAMLQRWADVTPDDFLFSVKMWRAITHEAAHDPARIHEFFEGIKPLGTKTGPVLFQLPPNRDSNPHWLATLLQALPQDHRYVFELRDRRWLNEEIYKILRDHNAANVFYDFRGFSNPEISTADFAYIRLHGPNKTPYKGAYAPARLRHYAQLMQGQESYAYFDNTMLGDAINDARILLDEMAGGRSNQAA